MKLGKLEEIRDLRSVWKHEALDFSPWLAENIGELGAELGIDIEVIEKESTVGDFSVDIFARDADTGRKIIIENQLEDTDHDHLGKLITYASGKNADLVIWIVKKAREEHRSAIEWLNAHTDEGIGFVLCELKLYRISGSEPAPKFVIIERPNDWAKEMKKSATETARTSLPKITDMLSWGIVKPGDQLKAKGRESWAQLLENGHVMADGEEKTMHYWLHDVYGWASVETYACAEYKDTGRTLAEMRREYMEKHGI